jgi:hypothetical protein
MKLIALVCNVVFFLFLCFVIKTDGISGEAFYITFTFLSLLIPVFNVIIILRSGTNDGWFGIHIKKSEEPGKLVRWLTLSSTVKLITVIINLTWMAKTCWIMIKEYPHPEEEGFVVFVVVMFLTPVITIVAVLLSKTKKSMAV